MDGLFLQTVEGLGEPSGPTGDEVWEWLESEKEDVAKEILSGRPLCNLALGAVQQGEACCEKRFPGAR